MDARRHDARPVSVLPLRPWMLPILFTVQLSVLLYLCSLSLIHLATPSAADYSRATDQYVQDHLARLAKKRTKTGTKTKTKKHSRHY